MLRFYAYKGCDGCRKARKWLIAKGVDFIEIPIRESPPTDAELRQALNRIGSIRLLFNTSGLDYRKMGLKDQLPQISEDEAIQLLHKNGNLVKRPFLTGADISLVGFKEAVWTETLIS